jgi:uncharacterized membrane protein YozB (DUF420 family)
MYRNYIRNHPTIVAILLFLLIFIPIHIAQPKFLYNTDGSIRQFGVGFRNKTILPIWLLSIILGILCYLFVLYYLAHPKLSF